MIKITEDVSQWDTMSTLINWINENKVELHPFVVDIGANDGKRLSNSWNLIVENGWKGLLVEPTADLIPVIEKNYKEAYVSHDKLISYTIVTGNQLKASFPQGSCDGRSQIVIVNCAISNISGKKHLGMVGNDSMLYSFVVPASMWLEVDCITPQELFGKCDAKVGILSVDTEGHDFVILKSMFEETKVRPQIIITESWPALVYDNLNKQSLLSNEGYQKILHCGENEIFIRR